MMNDNFINYQEKADKVFKWFEETQFERERKDLSYDDELMFSFADFVEKPENADTILSVSGLCGDFKDIDDAEAACQELISFMDKGIDKYFGNPVDKLVDYMKGVKQ